MGGIDQGFDGLSSVEVLTSSGLLLPCSVPPLPTLREYFTQNGEVVCGGYPTVQSCISLTGSDWTTSHQLVESRWGHSSWSSPAGLILMGGYDSGKTTELLSDTSSSSSPSFDLEYDTTHLSPGVSLIYDLAYDSGMLQSSLFTSRNQNLVLAKLPSSGFWRYGKFFK